MMKLALFCLIGIILLGLAVFKPDFLRFFFRNIQRLLFFCSSSERLSCIFVFVLSFGFYALLTIALGDSPPHIHDEFANLLAADTFSKGRLTNPPHPYWQFFESIHVLSQPTYMSKYPPAQGIMFASGQVVCGKPIVGAWLSAALACAAICWALFAWTRPTWAFLGGLIAIFHPVILKWSQVYWGGSEAMLGGALVFGAAKRLLSEKTVKNAVLFALGMVVLALSRPFEGLILTMLISLFLLYYFLQEKTKIHFKDLIRICVPTSVILSLFAGWSLYYNWRITGNPLKMPYMAYEEQYAVAPFLVFQKPRPIPVYNHQYIRDHFVNYAMEEYLRQQTVSGFFKECLAKIKRLSKQYLVNYVLILPLLALPWMVIRRGLPRVPIILFCGFMFILMFETWMWDRYAAPIGAVFFYLLVQGFRHLRLIRLWGRPLGFALILLTLGMFAVESVLWVKTRKWEYSRRDWDWQRLQIIKKLERDGGKHLIFVRYGAKQSVHNDWVHNGADIDGSSVIFARDMGASKNKELINYFKDRKVWLIEAENPWEPPVEEIQKVELKPYSME